MAKKQPDSFNTFNDFKIEVIRINKTKTEIIKKEMLLSQWIKLKKQPNYEYKAYQLGYSQFLLTE